MYERGTKFTSGPEQLLQLVLSIQRSEDPYSSSRSVTDRYRRRWVKDTTHSVEVHRE